MYWKELMDNGYYCDVDIMLFDNWDCWVHYDKNGKQYNLSHMTDEHLNNTANFFWKRWYNISPLLSEIEKRKFLTSNK